MIALVLGLCCAPGAQGASPAEIDALKALPCPAYLGWGAGASSPEERAAALAGRFDVLAGLETTLVPPVDWHQDPYGNRSWVHRLHALVWIHKLTDSYAEAGSVTALGRARDLALDWIASVRPGDDSYSPLAWLDKGVGDRAGPIAYVTRAAACEDALTDPQAGNLIDSLREHGAFLADPANHPPNNHGLFADFGLALIAHQLPFLPEAAGWESLAHVRFADVLAQELAPESGFYLEHSPHYQRIVADLTTQMAELRPDSELLSMAMRMRAAAGWFVMPGSMLVPLGDSSPVPVARGSWLGQSARQAKGQLAAFDAGLGVVKRAGGYLAVTTWFHRSGHRHGDDLGFQLRAGETDVVSDSGYHSYEAGGFGQFARSAAAHSVLTIDGRDLPRDGRFAYGSGLRAAGRGAGWFGFSAVNPLLRRLGVRHRRLFLYRPRVGLVIVDRLRSRREHHYTRRFQIAPGIKVRRTAGGWRLAGPSLRGFLDPGPGRRDGLRGRRDPIAGWTFPRFLAEVPRWTLVTRNRARDASLVTAIGLRGHLRARTARGSAGGLLVSVRPPDGRVTRLRVARHGQALRISRRPFGAPGAH